MTRGLTSSSRRVILVFLAVAVAATLVISVRQGTGGSNLHAHLAASFLAGRLDVQESLEDVAVYGGKFYVPFPPAPALLLLPFVAVLGVERTNPPLIAVLLSVVVALMLNRILRRLAVSSEVSTWIVAAFLLGTGYWLCATASASVWFFAHVVSVAFMVLAIDEVLGRGRAALAGAAFGMAFLSRLLMVFSAVFLMVALWHNPRFTDRRSRLESQARFLAVAGALLAAYLAYNWLRFGSVLDTGYCHIKLDDFQKERFDAYGLFHPIYVPTNLIRMFLQGFHIEFSPPTYMWPGRMNPDPFGTSITFASPFVFTALLARWGRPLLWAAWISIGATLVLVSFYLNNGWVQLNCSRFVLDVLPILILLAALGTERVPAWAWKAAVVYSIALNVIALFCIPAVNRLSG